MTNFKTVTALTAVIHELGSISQSPQGWRRQVEAALRTFPEPLAAVQEHMLSWSHAERADMLARSHETATHYKWLLHCSGPHFKLWLHDYKPAAARGAGYAEVPHNHRYDLCSRVLQGGFTNLIHQVVDDVAYQASGDDLVSGDLLSLDYRTVHSLANIVAGSTTLVVEGPRRSKSSTSYPPGAPARSHVDFDGRWDGLLIRIGESQVHPEVQPHR
ncbi:MAG TPA: hypothetical protein VGL05_34685 [Kribbella sp.]